VTASRSRAATLGAAFAFGAATAAVAQAPAGTIGADGWRKDLVYLVETIKAVHPRPFHRVLEPAFDSAVASLDRRLPALSDAQAALGLMGIVALVNDGHTSIQPGGLVFPLQRWYPIRIDRFADGFFVVATTAAHRDLLGTEIVRLGGGPIAAVWDTLETYAPGDNRFSRMARLPYWLMIPELVSALGAGRPDRLELEVKGPSGVRAVSVPVVAASQNMRLLFYDAAPGDSSVELPGAPPTERDLPFRWSSDPYWFEHERATGLLYARINQVGDSDQPVHLDREIAKLTLGDFGRRILARIDSGGVNVLVLDLRNNPGGNNYLIRPLVEGLAARPAVNSRGKLFVITGRRTYSAAMNFTSLLEDRTEAIFVGEPPGGSPSHYGDATGFELPVSKLRFNVSTLHWDLGVAPTDVREAQEPEIPVAPLGADRRAGRDGALAAIRAWKPGTSLAERLIGRYRAAGIDSAVAMARASVGEKPDDPWSSQVQQLVEFARAVVQAGGSGPDIYRSYRLATELYPNSAYAWFSLGRAYQFGRRPADAAAAFERAHMLRPGNDLIGRMARAARRQAGK
jgi:hypothetical protein